MEEDVSTEYKESLRDLQFNSKPLINMLTMLAEENIEQAPRIVRTIEEHLQKVPVEMKLPVLYLIDSIMKNVAGAYRSLFTQNIVSNFCNVFEKGDEKTRLQLFKLRQTWVELFPNKKLYALDQRVKQMDPAWPILAKPPQQPTIHVNPKFLEAKTPSEQNAAEAPKIPSVNSVPRPSEPVPLQALSAKPSEGEQIQRLLLQKQREFLALQQQKIELEMHLQQQQLKQKQDAEQLLKSLRTPSAIPVDGGFCATLGPPIRGPHPAMQQATRDPRLQQRVAPAEMAKPAAPPPSMPNSAARPSPAHQQTAPAEKQTPTAGSAKDDDSKSNGSPGKKFRIPKVSEREKGNKDAENDAGKSAKSSSPSKPRKADDRDNRHRSSSSSSSKSSTSSSPGRSKKRRGKGKGGGVQRLNNAEGTVAEKEPSGDVDMRIMPEKMREAEQGAEPGTGEEPPPKKAKGGESEASLGDFDYRRPDGGNSQRGWAQYKATHPDEFKSPLRPARENMEGRDQDLRHMPDGGGPHNGRGGFQGRGGTQSAVDRFGRPLLRRLMSDPRFRSHVQGRGEGGSNGPAQQLEHMLANPESFLQQTEEHLRSGRLNPELHRQLKADLEKLSQFRRSQPRITRGEWGGAPPGNFGPDDRAKSFPDWNLPMPFPGMNRLEGAQDLPPPAEPAPASGAIRVDTKMRRVQFVEDVAVLMLDGMDTRQIAFKGPPKRVFVDDMEPFLLAFDGSSREFLSRRTGKKRTIKFGAPLREIVFDGVPYSAQFGTVPLVVRAADGEIHVVRLEPPAPTVDIEKPPPDYILERLGLVPENLAGTDSDLRKLPAAVDNNTMDVDMRVPPVAEVARDVDLRKLPCGPFSEGVGPPASPDRRTREGPRNSPQRGGAPWPPRPQEDAVFPKRDSPERGGWVRYGSEERSMGGGWQQQAQQPLPPLPMLPQQVPQQQGPPAPQQMLPHQEPGIHARWRPPVTEWNSFGNDFGRGPSRRGNQQPGFGKEYPSYFREDFPQQQQMRPQQMGGDMLRPNFPPHYSARGPSQFQPEVGPPMQVARLPTILPPRPLDPSRMGQPPRMQGLEQPPRGPYPPMLGAPPFLQAEAPAVQAGGAPASALEVNVEDLFIKLVAAGILKSSAGARGNKEDSNEEPAHEPPPVRKELEKIPPLSFQKVDMLKIKYPGVISALHVGTQCASCGLRFTDEKSEKYSQHLDWHFRSNRRDKDGARKAFSRKWFYEVEDWIQFEEIEDLEERARSFFEQQASVEQDQSSNSPTVIKSVPATGEETQSRCAVCEEAFQLFWVEEEEEWHFRDAVRIEDKIYHPACYEDFKRASEAPASPIPKTEPKEPPLLETADVKAEPEEEEKPMETDEAQNPASDVAETSAEPAEPTSEETVAEEAEGGATTTVCDEALPIKDDKKGDEMQEDPVVIVDNLGEFGVSLCDGESGEDQPEDDAPCEPKVVVKGSGGIVLKVKAESIQAPASPAAATVEERPKAPDNGNAAEDEQEFRPPTPDPRFTVLPPVQRGNELSGLCSIM